MMLYRRDNCEAHCIAQLMATPHVKHVIFLFYERQ